MSAGFIGVVVPLYLAECLAASHPRQRHGHLPMDAYLGIVVAALVGMYYSYRVHAVAKLSANAATLFTFKDTHGGASSGSRCRPACCLCWAGFFVSESPRWLFRRGERDKAYAALLRSRTPEQAAS